ncbi:MAG: GNAT family N-acetyltransferase [Taibaiella sp.]|nr:GNAT family N-acetyltransferase [Taibaiella sp.]
MSEQLTIRKVTPADIDALSDVSITTFKETYTEHNTPENMELYMDEYFNPERLKEEIEDDRNVFFFAYIDDEIAGYIKLSVNKQPAALKKATAIEIERIYVLKKYHDQKIGSALLSYSISYSITHGYDMLWLGVWESNERAINFYKRWGFEIFGDHIFQLGTEAQTDLLMKRKC